jgi:hypothetical protein
VKRLARLLIVQASSLHVLGYGSLLALTSPQFRDRLSGDLGDPQFPLVAVDSGDGRLGDDHLPARAPRVSITASSVIDPDGPQCVSSTGRRLARQPPSSARSATGAAPLASAIPLELGTRCPEQRPVPMAVFLATIQSRGEGSQGRLTQA